MKQVLDIPDEVFKIWVKMYLLYGRSFPWDEIHKINKLLPQNENIFGGVIDNSDTSNRTRIGSLKHLMLLDYATETKKTIELTDKFIDRWKNL